MRVYAQTEPKPIGPAPTLANAQHRQPPQRRCACGGIVGPSGECAACKAKRQAAERQYSAPPIVHDVLRSSGQPLDAATRAVMEPHFGHDFSRVRIHTDAKARESALAVNALAYTVGNDVVIGSGHYAPETRDGRRLVAHELTHTIQQAGASAAGPLTIGRANDSFEREAGQYAQLSSQRPLPAISVASARRVQRLPLDDAGPSATPSRPGRGGSTLPYREATELLECIRIMGQDNADYCRQEVLGEQPVPVPFGRWALAQTNTNGSAGSGYQSSVTITFDPDDRRVNCTEIAFVQNVRVVDTGTNTSRDTRPNFANRRTATGWTIDRLDQRSFGWYGFNNDGTPSGTVTPGSAPTPHAAASMTDTPGWDTPGVSFDFETCAICRTGTQVNQVYGCLTWGFAVDASLRLTSHPTAESLGPSAEFDAAIRRWNRQAGGPAARRNAPRQRRLGPFR